MAVNEERLHAFLGKAVTDLGAAVSAVLIQIGDELGLYRALAPGPLQALCLANPNGPVDLAGAYELVEALFHASACGASSG